MRIGDVVRSTGAGPKAIRRYEALGLITPIRLANGYRDYSDEQVRAVREIRALNRLGIRVEATRPFLECLFSGSEFADDCPSSLAGYRTAIDILTDRITAMTEQRDVLRQRLHRAATRGDHRALPESAALPTGLPAPVDDGAAAHLPGRRLPPLTLESTDGTRITLSTLGNGRTILYLYPLTGHPDIDLPVGWNEIPGARGRTAQACDFRDHHRDLVAAGAARVYGLSSQTSSYQRELVDRLRLPFAMLSDPRLRLADALAAPTFDADEMTLYRRMTLIVTDGVIEHVFYPVFPPDRHAAQVVRWLERRFRDVGDSGARQKFQGAEEDGRRRDDTFRTVLPPPGHRQPHGTKDPL